MLSSLSTLDRFLLVDEALEWPRRLESSVTSPVHGSSPGLNGPKRPFELLRPIGFRQVLNLGLESAKGNRFRGKYLMDVAAGELEADLGEAVSAARAG